MCNVNMKIGMVKTCCKKFDLGMQIIILLNDFVCVDTCVR